MLGHQTTWSYLESELLDRGPGIGHPLEGIVVLAKVVVKPGAPDLALGQGHGDVLPPGQAQAGQ